jgi:hypothetical protein
MIFVGKKPQFNQMVKLLDLVLNLLIFKQIKAYYFFFDLLTLTE